MKISLEWLSDHIDLPCSAEELADRLTNTGTEVASIERTGVDLEGLITGKIKEIKIHPEDHNVSITFIEVGKEDPLQVLTDKKLELNQILVLAPIGSQYSGKVVKEAEYKGVKSWAWIPSEKDLEISEDSNNAVILPPGISLGLNALQLLKLKDQIVELEITPNRSDCLSMRGLAREIAAIFGIKLKPFPTFETSANYSKKKIEEVITIDQIDFSLCPRYTAAVLEEVRPAPSPLWLKRRLQAIGIGSISNIVDATNYILMDCGQPLHAFDLDQLEGAEIKVRKALDNEKITTLDKQERSLVEQFLVIADAKKPVAIAGIMGGLPSSVSNQTRRILLESAWFEPVNIRKSSKKLALSTDSSYRFERGIDFAQVPFALKRAAALTSELTAGVILSGFLDRHQKLPEPRRISIRQSRVNKVMGVSLIWSESKKILKDLGLSECPESSKNEDQKTVEIPSFRLDIVKEIDLIEEIARIHGYNKIKATLPQKKFRPQSEFSEFYENFAIDKMIRQICQTWGFNEIVTYSMVDPILFENLPQIKEDYSYQTRVVLSNPVNREQGILRTSLIPGLLSTLKRNLSIGIQEVKLFELGKTFFISQASEKPKEIQTLSALLYGSILPKSWQAPELPASIFYLKGLLNDLVEAIGLSKINPAKKSFELRQFSDPFFHPGRAAEVYVNEEKVGVLGQVQNSVAVKYDLEKEFYLFEIYLDYEESRKVFRQTKQYNSPPRYPAVLIDLAVVLDKKITANQIESELKLVGGNLLESVELFDLYEGSQVPEGKRSLAFSLVFRKQEGTLTASEVELLKEKMLQRLAEKYNAYLR